MVYCGDQQRVGRLVDFVGEAHATIACHAHAVQGCRPSTRLQFDVSKVLSSLAMPRACVCNVICRMSRFHTVWALCRPLGVCEW